MRIAMSSGHGKYIRGASGYLDEVNEARKVVEQVAVDLRAMGVDCVTFHDDSSTTQGDNLNRIVNWHNSKERDYDVSVHFNAYETTSKPMGTECLYVTQLELAGDVSTAIAKAIALPNRGAKKRTDLKFLNSTDMPAILIEVCFVDSSTDAEHYKKHFKEVCAAIALSLSAEEEVPSPTPTRWRENITATVFGNPGDEQEGAYGGWIDPDTVGVALPYKWRDGPRPKIVVEGPNGWTTANVVDVGPWNTDDPEYVLNGARPMVEIQFDEGVEAQNGRVPTNDAAIDLTVPVAQAVGIDGKGKVRWRIE